jgi:4-hydroxybenzoate polyprenyltransferase
LLRQVFDFVVFTSLFIACCAVLMTYQTSLIFDTNFPVTIYAFVFSGSVCSYNFHWFLTPPNVSKPSYKLSWNITNKSLHLTLFIIGFFGAAITSFLLLEHWIWLGLTAFLTFMYSAPKINHPATIWLRKIAIGKTIFLAFAWMHVTTLLPLLIAVNKLEAQHWWFVVNRFLFIYAICIVFDRRDIKSDRKAGIKSLITFLSLKGVDILFWTSLAVSILTSLPLLLWMPSVDILILNIPAVIMGLLYNYSKRNYSDYLYYFLLDGLMALSAPILILIKFAR